MTVDRIAWDLGGAHLKVVWVDASARVRGVRQRPCPLWRGIEQLDKALREVLQDWPSVGVHRITMTGELVDWFPDRTAGVLALTERMQQHLPTAELSVFAGRIGLVAPSEVERWSNEIASANWLATTKLAASRLPHGIVLDIGSTTTDVVPFLDGQVLGDSISDGDRLRRDELVYTGVVRTPICAVAQRVPFAGYWQGICAELFASMADVYRLLGELPEDADQLATADGRGKTAADSLRRFARMLGRDADWEDRSDWLASARYLARKQQEHIQDALDRCLSAWRLPQDTPLIGAGVGRFVATRIAVLLGRPYRDFASLCDIPPQWAKAAADCAPALALALLPQDKADVGD